MRRIALILEAGLVFGGLPLFVALALRGQPFFPVLWAAALGCGVLLWRDDAFVRRRLGYTPGFWREFPRVVLRFIVLGVLVVLATLRWQPQLFLYLPRYQPRLWALIMVCYPVVSVYPQAVVSRAYLFHRYRDLVPGGWPMVLVSGAVFAFSHIIFFNVWALLLTAIGGVLFADTYRRSESLLLSAIEHALYGNLLFTVGLGYLVYHGNA